MKAIAEYFGYEQDVQQYADDAKQVGDAIVNHAWDEESGYFGYVVHDGNLYAAGILRTETGENYNKGVDGVTPLIAGVTTPAATCTPDKSARAVYPGRYIYCGPECWILL